MTIMTIKMFFGLVILSGLMLGVLSVPFLLIDRKEGILCLLSVILISGLILLACYLITG